MYKKKLKQKRKINKKNNLSSPSTITLWLKTTIPRSSVYCKLRTLLVPHLLTSFFPVLTWIYTAILKEPPSQSLTQNKASMTPFTSGIMLSITTKGRKTNSQNLIWLRVPHKCAELSSLAVLSDRKHSFHSAFNKSLMGFQFF